MDIKELHQLFINSTGICTDTRKVKLNALFFALKGDNFNGNKYAKNAVNEGCSFAIVDEKEYVLGDNYIEDNLIYLLLVSLVVMVKQLLKS